MCVSVRSYLSKTQISDDAINLSSSGEHCSFCVRAQRNKLKRRNESIVFGPRDRIFLSLSQLIKPYKIHPATHKNLSLTVYLIFYYIGPLNGRLNSISTPQATGTTRDPIGLALVRGPNRAQYKLFCKVWLAHSACDTLRTVATQSNRSKTATPLQSVSKSACQVAN